MRKINISLNRSRTMIAEGMQNRTFDPQEIHHSGLMQRASNLLTRAVLEEYPRTVNIVLW